MIENINHMRKESPIYHDHKSVPGEETAIQVGYQPDGERAVQNMSIAYGINNTTDLPNRGANITFTRELCRGEVITGPAHTSNRNSEILTPNLVKEPR